MFIDFFEFGKRRCVIMESMEKGYSWIEQVMVKILDIVSSVIMGSASLFILFSILCFFLVGVIFLVGIYIPEAKEFGEILYWILREILAILRDLV